MSKYAQKILEATPHLIYIYDMNLKKNIYVNHDGDHFLGYTPDQIRELWTGLFRDVLHSDDVHLIFRHHERLKTAENSEIIDVHYRMKNADGQWRWLRSRDVVFMRDSKQAVTQILGSVEDITVQLQREKELNEYRSQLERIVVERTRDIEQSEALFAETQRIIHAGNWTMDVQTGQVTCSDEYLRLFGFPTGIKMPSYEEHLKLICADHLDPFKTAIRKILENGEGFQMEIDVRRTDGKLVTLFTMVEAQQGNNGKVSRLIGTIQDITHRKQIETAIQKAKNELEIRVEERTAELSYMNEQMRQEIVARTEAEELYRAITNSSHTGVYIIQDGRFQFLNPQAAVRIGYDLDELIGMETSKLIYPDDLEPTKKNAVKMLLGERKSPYEFRVRTGNGDIIWVMESVANIHYQGKPAILGNSVEITERLKAENEKKILESQLQQAQKMEAIGTLAGGIAHDFNNILAAITGYLELALMDIEPNARIRRYLERGLNAGERAVELVKQILTFCRQGKQEIRPLVVSSVVKEAVKLLRATLPKFIEIRQNISEDKHVIMADPIHIHQIIMNLCTNAAHAMREKTGILEIGLSRIDIGSQQSLSYVNLPAGSYLELTVKDTGHGIPPEIVDKIFDPFFTTKRAGEGTGMGLAVVYGIVKQAGGNIFVESEVGIGSAFRICIPLVENRQISEGKGSSSFIPEGHERILVVDDEEDIVLLMEDGLSRLGYKVISQKDPEEALRIFLAKPDLFDLIITDMNMPKMTGVELAEHILKVRAGMPLILCTGYSDLVTPECAKAMGIGDLLYKPVFRKQLAKSVRQVLDKENEETFIATT